VRIDIIFKGDHSIAKVNLAAYLVDDLKAKLLIRVNVIAPKGFLLNFERRIVTIASYKNLSFPITIYTKPDRLLSRTIFAVTKRTLQLGETATIPLRLRTNLPDRDFVFHLDDLPCQAFSAIIGPNFSTISLTNTTTVL
jgi:hypothetical protein